MTKAEADSAREAFIFPVREVSRLLIFQTAAALEATTGWQSRSTARGEGGVGDSVSGDRHLGTVRGEKRCGPLVHKPERRVY
ncbi:hypothetical protein NN561_006455 [Cricetulus griseus]